MTTEEINKAGWEYVNESIDETTEIPKNIELIKASAVVDFIEGAKFVNKHWQEKTKYYTSEEISKKYAALSLEEKNEVLYEAIDYMQIYNGRSRFLCIAMAMGYDNYEGDNKSYFKR